MTHDEIAKAKAGPIESSYWGQVAQAREAELKSWVSGADYAECERRLAELVCEPPPFRADKTMWGKPVEKSVDKTGKTLEELRRMTPSEFSNWCSASGWGKVLGS
jgi:hypothetical protein